MVTHHHLRQAPHLLLRLRLAAVVRSKTHPPMKDPPLLLLALLFPPGSITPLLNLTNPLLPLCPTCRFTVRLWKTRRLCLKLPKQLEPAATPYVVRAFMSTDLAADGNLISGQRHGLCRLVYALGAQVSVKTLRAA